MTKQEAAKAAIDLQNACNLGGVTNTAHKVFVAFCDGGTKAGNESAPMKLVVHQMAWLATGQVLLAADEFDKAYTECERLATT